MVPGYNLTMEVPSRERLGKGSCETDVGSSSCYCYYGMRFSQHDGGFKDVNMYWHWHWRWQR